MFCSVVIFTKCCEFVQEIDNCQVSDFSSSKLSENAVPRLVTNDEFRMRVSQGHFFNSRIQQDDNIID
jgi:hypothetical protein